MLPGKQYAPPDFLLIARRWAWVWLLPLAVASVVAVAYARSLPNLYRSESTILVVPQRVPEAYVRSTVTSSISDRLPAIQQQILSRTRLERTIQEFDLYPTERRTQIMEDVIQKMRDDIGVNLINRGDAFRVSYIGPDPVVVMKVTQRLSSMFIEESLRQRGSLAEGTTEFLDSQLEETRRQLQDKEQKRAAYYHDHLGELPSQLESNLQQVGSVRSQIQQLVESMNRDQDNLLSLERQLAEAKASPAGVATSADSAEGAPAGSLAEQLAAARARAEALTARFRPGHPDLEQARRLVRDLEQRMEADALQTSVSGPAVATSPLEIERQRRIATLQERIRELEKQTALKKAEEQRLRAAANTLQARIDVVPTRSTELSELERDYGTLQTLYTSLLAKKGEARISENLERRQVGEQFQLVDPARVAERPSSPNRQRLILMGMAIGLAIGVALVGLLEYRDSTFKTDEEVATVLQIPVLAVVPLMRSTGEERRAFHLRLLAGIGVGGAAACSLAVLVYALVFVR